MSDPKQPQDDWIEVGKSRAAQHVQAAMTAEASGPPAEERILGQRKATPPGLVSLRVGIVAIVLAVTLYIFADLRDIEVPWRRQFRIGYFLMLIPAFGILWGIIGFAKRETDDLRRAAIGFVLSLAAFGLGAAMIASGPPPKAVAPVITSERVKMPPADLNKWREKKLHEDAAQ